MGFDSHEYLKANMDVADSGMSAFEHWNKYGKFESRPLSFKNEKKYFEENGFFLFKNSLEQSVVEKAYDSICRFKSNNLSTWSNNVDANGYVRRVTNLHNFSPEIKRLFSLNAAARFCDYMFESKTCVYTSLFFEAGSEQPIHRDSPYFHTVPINAFFGFWVALEDITIDNGPLSILRKGHLSQEVDLDSIALDFYSDLNALPSVSDELWNAYQQKMYSQCIDDGLYDEKILMEKGDTFIWHPMLPHGGSQILNPKLSRNSIVFHVTPPETPVYRLDAFFNRSKQLSNMPTWSYSEFENRFFAQISKSILFPGTSNGVRDEVILD